MQFQFKDALIPDLKIITPQLFSDQRGVFFETYKKSLFDEQNIKVTFVQENRSVSRKNVMRGLHYQKESKAQGKLVSVQTGKIFDVAVDIRKNSPTFGKHKSTVLDGSEVSVL